MSNRRVDAIYFVLLLLVFAFGTLAANRSPDEVANLELPDFSPPPLTIEIPFELPYAIVEFEHLAVPKLNLSDDMESVLGEVRLALLQRSTRVEVRFVERNAAVELSGAGYAGVAAVSTAPP